VTGLSTDPCNSVKRFMLSIRGELGTSVSRSKQNWTAAFAIRQQASAVSDFEIFAALNRSGACADVGAGDWHRPACHVPCDSHMGSGQADAQLAGVSAPFGQYHFGQHALFMPILHHPGCCCIPVPHCHAVAPSCGMWRARATSSFCNVFAATALPASSQPSACPA
jgi:hypothetical protein